MRLHAACIPNRVQLQAGLHDIECIILQSGIFGGGKLDEHACQYTFAWRLCASKQALCLIQVACQLQEPAEIHAMVP